MGERRVDINLSNNAASEPLDRGALVVLGRGKLSVNVLSGSGYLTARYLYIVNGIAKQKAFKSSITSGETDIVSLVDVNDGSEAHIKFISISNVTPTTLILNIEDEGGVILNVVQIRNGESLLYEDDKFRIVSSSYLRPQEINVTVETGSGGSGDSVRSSIELGEDIGGGIVVYISAGLAYKYNQSNTALYDRVFGITNAAGVTSDMVDIVTSGKCNAMGGLTEGDMYFALDNGLVSNIPPATGIYQPLGIAKSPTELIVNIQKPYIR